MQHPLPPRHSATQHRLAGDETLDSTPHAHAHSRFPVQRPENGVVLGLTTRRVHHTALLLSPEPFFPSFHSATNIVIIIIKTTLVDHQQQKQQQQQ